MKDLIRICNLRKSYEGFTLDMDELAVSRGTVMGLIGENGAGKTSTIKAMLGLIRADAGTVELFGLPAHDERRLVEAKRRIGVVLDTCPFPAELLVREVARIGQAAYPTWSQQDFEALCTRFALDGSKRVKELSRGMGMKLQLAFALAHNPELLVLDEPTAGLDPLAREDVLGLLREHMDDNRGILISTHITSDLDKIADYVTCVRAGRVAFSQSIDEIRDQAGMLRCRAAELDAVLAAGLFAEGALRVLKGAYGLEVLVPDRFALADALPHLACERASVESYLTLMLKGEPR